MIKMCRGLDRENSLESQTVRIVKPALRSSGPTAGWRLARGNVIQQLYMPYQSQARWISHNFDSDVLESSNCVKEV